MNKKSVMMKLTNMNNKCSIIYCLLFILFCSCDKKEAVPNPLYWAINGGGINHDRVMKSVIDKNGNVYVTGYITGDWNLPNKSVKFGDRNFPVEAGTGPFLAKINQYGQYQWVKILGSGRSGIIMSLDVNVDQEGNIYLYGLFCKSALYNNIIDLKTEGYYLAKCNNNGEPIWTKEIIGQVSPNRFSIDEQHNLFISGQFHYTEIKIGSHTLTARTPQIYLAKFSSDGEVLWAKQTGQGSNSIYVTAMTLDKSGNSYIGGAFEGSGKIGNSLFTSKDGDADVFIAKYTNDGESTWVKTAGGSRTDVCKALAIHNDQIYMTGTFRDIANFDQLKLASQNSSVDIFLAKYDLNGSIAWVKPFGGDGEDVGYAIDIHDNNLYVAGTFSKTASFGNYTLSAVNNWWDSFIMKLDTEGKIQAIQQYNLGGGSLRNITIDAKEDIYVSGECEYKATFDNTTLSSYGSNDVFIAKTKIY